ncbi:uncharacterized protein LOC106647145 [Copidosoma floridanum]|uniref:uncharacterized protein LOC106647145 n=1 Tax=Copidosoma floridanum TaxID=29053 RepID=UPI0006C9873B|nr:uncharacterized protein LOC106647145 [Copidosoma floridanum]
MNVCATGNVVIVETNLIEENNKNVPVNVSCDGFQDYSGSQDIFSDDDQVKSTTYFSPKITLANNTHNSSIISLKTPTLFKNTEESPGKAIIPRTPADLKSFIAKTSLLWTSDMETPESNLRGKADNCDKTENSVHTSSMSLPKTPNSKEVKPGMDALTSPVLGGKKRSRKYAKRRILSTINMDLDIDQQSSISSNSDKVPSDAADSVNNEPITDNKLEPIPNECFSPIKSISDLNENKPLCKNTKFDKNSNTSTQEFFINASFTSIDQLCYSINQDEKPSLTDLSESRVKKYNIVKEENEDVDHHMLDRIASIKRNQKPLKRLSDINHTIIPKEVFSSSVKDLEIANAKFTVEKRDTKSEPLKSMSFTKFSDLKNLLEQNEQSKKDEEPNNHFNNAVPPEFVEDWNAMDLQVNENVFVKKEKPDVKPAIGDLITLPITSTNSEGNVICNSNLIKKELSDLGISSSESDTGFSTANGKGIVVNEDTLLNYKKIYSEIESETLNENTFIGLKKNKLQLPKSKDCTSKFSSVANVNKSSLVEDGKLKKVEKLKLFEELDLQEFLEPKSSAECTETMNNGFSTANGKHIKISEEKENYYSNVYNELSDVNQNSLNTLKANKKPSLKLNTKPSEKTVNLMGGNNFNNCTITSLTFIENGIEVLDKQTTDGFSTARGKKIDVSDEKENYYSNVYKELDNVDENGLSSLKRRKLQSKTIKKPFDKAVVAFNRDIKNSKTTNAVENKITVVDTKATNDCFSTAGGKNISIDPEKEQFYSKMYEQLSQEVNNENSLLHLNKKKFSKLSCNKNHINKPSTSMNRNKKSIEDVKLSMSSDTDHVFYNLGDLEKLFQIDSAKTEVGNDNCLSVPSASHTPVNTNPFRSLPKSMHTMEGNKADIGLLRTSSPIAKPENKPMKSQIGNLKLKLESCEPKRTERCRSFCGFPVANNVSPDALKLNKSDPVDETYANQPLQQGLSISQCFDPHSDSWLSKIEISHLNSSKVNSPDPKVKKHKSKKEENTALASDSKSEKFGDLRGFSFQDSVESFRRYSRYESFLKKHLVKYDKCIDLYIYEGETISISNQTSVRQHLSVQCANTLNVQKSTKVSHYDVIKASPVKLPEKCNVVIEKVAKGGEKRKHMDTEVTPLTRVKKPRVGFEFPGKKLFSNESDIEECSSKFNEQKNSLQSSLKETELRVKVVDKDLSKERWRAIQQQEKIIKNKKQIKVKPVVGSLLQERLVNSKNRKSWSDIVGNFVPNARKTEHIILDHPDAKVLEVTASNAICYKFISSNIIGNEKVVSLDVGDGASLIFDENGHAGVAEFVSAFLAMQGVDPKLLPTGWIENHYRWIVWKLASIDRIHFDSLHLPKTLKPERVMQELKYRYDREIDRAERPALRRILEKDDVPTRRMVLCISLVEEQKFGDETEKESRIRLGLSHLRVEATDGWYSIPLTLDNSMTSYVLNGKIKEGTKIITYGAELLECERGFHPLEKPTNVSLKLHANCTRRARWDTKLGFQLNSRPLPIKLKTVLPNGGLVGQVTIVAARVYPLLYREKTANGQSIYRNARSEEKAAIAHERTCQLKMDVMYAEAEKKFDSKNKSDSDEEFELSQRATKSQEKMFKHDHLERKQEQFKQRLESKMREGLPPPRQVTPVLKVRLVDDRSTAMLSIWGANEDSSYDVKEGSTITVYNAFASAGRGNELSLTANRFTHLKTETMLKLPYPIRICTLIPDITSSCFEPKFNEIDTIGVVVSWGPAPYGMKNFDVMNLAYPKPGNEGSSYLSVLFWGGINSYGYQGLFTPGAVVACSNLEYRRNSAWSVALAYCSEKSVFTCNPRQSYLSKEIRSLKDVVQNPVTYAESCINEVQAELSKKLKPRSNQSTPTGPISERTSFHNNSSLLGPQDSPAGITIQRRLEKLSQYGSMSDVSPHIVLKNSSSRVKKDYTPVTPRYGTR